MVYTSSIGEAMVDHELEALQERYADFLQADFYATNSGFNEILEEYAYQLCLSDEETEEAAQMFEIEQVAGQSAGGHVHQIVADIAWRKAHLDQDKESLTNYLKGK